MRQKLRRVEVLTEEKAGREDGSRWGAGVCAGRDKTGASVKAQVPRVSCQGQTPAVGCVPHRSPQKGN